MIVKGNRTIQLEVAVHININVHVNSVTTSLVLIVRCHHLVTEGQAVSRSSEYKFSQRRWSSASFRIVRIRTSRSSANSQALSDGKEF